MVWTTFWLDSYALVMEIRFTISDTICTFAIVLINRTVIGDLGIQQCVQADPPVLGIQNIVTLFRYQISILIQCKLSCTGVFGVGLSCLIGKFNGKKAISG